MRIIKHIFTGFLLLAVVSAGAQEPEKAPVNKKISILPVPAFGYEPETRFYIGAVGLSTFRGKADSSRHSTLEAEINLTQNRQAISRIEWNAFFQQEKFRTLGKIGYQKFPDLFFGVGNNTHYSLEEPFESNIIEATPRFLALLNASLYGGVGYRLNYQYKLKTDPKGILIDEIGGKHGSISSGAGLISIWDSRDHTMSPSKGEYGSMEIIFFEKWLGSSFRFQAVEIDLRKYIPLFSGKHVMAFQVEAKTIAGTVPFNQLALLGSDVSMRGYYSGRFRDKNYMAFQGEYRLPIYWRFGAVVFAGMGQVAEAISKVAVNGLKPSYGGGLRFMVDTDDRVNLRLDFALGKDSQGFYISFGEAF